MLTSTPRKPRTRKPIVCEIVMFGDDTDIIVMPPGYDESLLPKDKKGKPLILDASDGHRIAIVTLGTNKDFIAKMQAGGWTYNPETDELDPPRTTGGVR